MTAKNLHLTSKKTEVYSDKSVQGHTASEIEALRLESMTVPL